VIGKPQKVNVLPSGVCNNVEVAAVPAKHKKNPASHF
jgi:hypothetical protein